jgi:hypothetical protein
MIVYYTKENGRCETDREYIPADPHRPLTLHRVDGPAIEYINGIMSGHKQWWVDGRCHRTDGPAVITHEGMKYYWIDDKWLSLDEFLEQSGWSKDKQMLYKLTES